MIDDAITPIQSCLDRLRAGDASVRGELIRVSQERVKLVVRRLMKRYHSLRRWTQSEDVLQEALVRLDHALQTISLDSTTDYLRLAAYHIRLVLIDFARHFFGPEGVAANHATPKAGKESAPAIEPACPGGDDPANALAWVELHERIAELPEEEREVVDLHWYHGMLQKDIATLLGVSTKTVRRRWSSAKLRLAAQLRRDLFD